MSKSQVVTPKGTAQWPWLINPDTKFDDQGKYKTDILFSKNDAKDLMAKCKELFTDEFGEKGLKSAKWPFTVDEETGGVRFRAKSSNKPALFDSQGQVIKNDLNVGTGSTIKVAGVLSTYSAGGNTGVTMYLNAVQVIDLVEFGSNAFGAEDGGYVHQDKPAKEVDEQDDDPFADF